MTEVGLVAAFAAGLLALLSPCSALLLPSFFAYAFASTRALVLRTAAFYGGLVLTLVPLGTGAGAASALFYGHRSLLVAVAGWSIIALGLFQLLGRGFAVPFVGRLQARTAQISRGGGTTWLSTVALGAVYGLAGFCSGPVLGAILTMAATQGPLRGGALLAVYALGMAAPLFLLAALWDRFALAQRRWLRGRMLRLGTLRVHSTSLISGALFISIGVLFLRYDGTAGIVGAVGVGDTTDLEFEAQRWIAEATAGVPPWLPALGVGVVAAGVAWRRRYPGGVRVLVVDAANVVGSRPDGWWRDRAGAARRLRDRLLAADLPHDRVVLVLEGAAKPAHPEGEEGRLRTVHARGEGDDTIVAEARAAADAGAQVTVVTADRGLRNRVAAGAEIVGPSWLLERLRPLADDEPRRS